MTGQGAWALERSLTSDPRSTLATQPSGRVQLGQIYSWWVLARGQPSGGPIPAGGGDWTGVFMNGVRAWTQRQSLEQTVQDPASTQRSCWVKTLLILVY